MKVARIHELQGDQRTLKAVLALARECGYERGHTHQVTRAALLLFDELRGLHGMGPDERFSLQCAGLLHDIGWCEGQKGHHKTAMRIILAAEGLGMSKRRRAVVAQIARYHRKAIPKPGHPEYQELAPADRRRVDFLAGILRVADALDRSHQDLLEDLSCVIAPKTITLRCHMTGPAAGERAAAAEKADLLERAFGRKVVLEFTQP